MSELLLPLGWVVTGGFWRTLVLCLLICPVIPQLLGLVFVSYWAPWNPRQQFLAYIPGNPLLALFIAGTSTTFVGSGPRISATWNTAILCGAFVGYVAMNALDIGNYTKEQLKSANKVYHNALYFWYGYLAAVCFAALLGSSASFGMKLLITLPGLAWLGCLVADNMADYDTKLRRFRFAHAGNLPIWKNGWRLRRRGAWGYVSDRG